MEPYKESQRLWVEDLHPAVETVFEFVEPYRDPFGVRAEFEGLVAIVDNDQTVLLERLVEDSPRFIQKLPWCGLTSDNDGKGLFEKASMDSPDFTSLHGESSLRQRPQHAQLTFYQRLLTVPASYLLA